MLFLKTLRDDCEKQNVLFLYMIRFLYRNSFLQNYNRLHIGRIFISHQETLFEKEEDYNRPMKKLKKSRVF